MSQSPSDEVRSFFREYVFGFIFSDIQREIDLARLGKGGGNFLAALGLLCYTEVMGGVRRGTLARGEGSANFNTFFKELGDRYASLAERREVYRDLRCGMAHQYLVKGPATVSMLKGNEPCGVTENEGRLSFSVERYFEDFAAACRRLHDDLLDKHALLPPELR